MTKSRRAIIKMLEADGWIFVRAVGSHHQFKHPTKPGKVTVPHPAKEICIATLRSVYRQAGWDWNTRS